MIRDGPACAALLASLHQASFPTGERWNSAEFASLLLMPGCFACVYEAVATPCGMALLRVVSDEAEVLTIAVLPQARGQGAGAALLSMALLECARRGADHAFLEVAPDNLAAGRLYSRHGFVEIGRRRRYYPDGSDALVMRRRLR